MEWKKLLGLFTASLVTLGAYVMIRGNAAGIIPIGTEAVYISGEACTVNAQLERSPQALLNDCRTCVALHTAFVKNAQTSSTSTTATSTAP